MEAAGSGEAGARAESDSSNGNAAGATESAPERSPSVARSTSDDLSACAGPGPWSSARRARQGPVRRLLAWQMSMLAADMCPRGARVHEEARAARQPRRRRRRRPAQAAVPDARAGQPGRHGQRGAGGRPRGGARQLAPGRMDARGEAGPAGAGGRAGALRRGRLGGARPYPTRMAHRAPGARATQTRAPRFARASHGRRRPRSARPPAGRMPATLPSRAAPVRLCMRQTGADRAAGRRRSRTGWAAGARAARAPSACTAR